MKRAVKRYVRIALGQKPKSTKSVDISSASDLIEAAHWIETDTLRMNIPTHMLCMQGAVKYNQSHPFVMALAQGRLALENFYKTVEPQNIAEYYGLSPTTSIGGDLPAWELPWYKRTNRTPPPGEGHLSASHGVSYYGPASQEKISLEIERLESVVQAIKKNGYQPDNFGDIEGYILKSGDEACFFVRGGKHRAAALVHLGHESIPVTFRSTFPRVVDVDQAKYWPLVRDGTIAIDLAKKIINKYVKTKG